MPEVFTINEEKIEEDVVTERTHELVVLNDDFNTFDRVIQSLMEVVDHKFEQAEQSSLLIHYKWRCTVDGWDLVKLKPRKGALIERWITAIIETLEA